MKRFFADFDRAENLEIKMDVRQSAYDGVNQEFRTDSKTHSPGSAVGRVSKPFSERKLVQNQGYLNIETPASVI